MEVVVAWFQMQYSKTTTHMMCTKLDFPPVSSAIIWARQVRAHVGKEGVALSPPGTKRSLYHFRCK